jgi:hypothetical protein
VYSEYGTCFVERGLPAVKMRGKILEQLQAALILRSMKYSKLLTLGL